jgi:hypothetical protein
MHLHFAHNLHLCASLKSYKNFPHSHSIVPNEMYQLKGKICHFFCIYTYGFYRCARHAA